MDSEESDTAALTLRSFKKDRGAESAATDLEAVSWLGPAGHSWSAYLMTATAAARDGFLWVGNVWRGKGAQSV